MQLIRIALLIFFSMSFVACAGTQTTPDGVVCPSCEASPKYDHACKLVIAPCSRAKISEIDKILDNLFKTKKPIVLYVHGRGDEPEKTLKKGIIKTLEKDYDVKVLMFNWHSYGFAMARPVGEAKAGAPYLREVIDRLKKYREAKPDSKAVPVSLLVHSMGNIVFRSAVDGQSLTLSDKSPLFTNILMTGSDENAEGHNIWVDKLACSGAILITINRKDAMLEDSNHHDGTSPLGINPKPPLAEKAYYLDVTGLVGGVHRLFEKGRQHGRVGICHILTAMLRGEKPNLVVGQDIKQVNGRILVPVENQNKADECFQGVQDKADKEDDG